MPSGKTHERLGVITLIAGTAWIGASAITNADGAIPLSAKVMIIPGLIFGIFLTPDIDLTTRTHEEKRMMYIPVFGKMWIAFWASYSWWFEHRGLSHWPIIGTLTRVFWLFRPLIGMAIGLAILVATDTLAIQWLREPEPILKKWMIPFFVGWTMQDFVHEMADIIVSEHKKKIKERHL